MASSLFQRTLSSLRKRGVLGFVISALHDVTEACARILVKIRDHHGSASIHGEPGNADTAVFILAGYKPALWPLTLRRVRRFVPKGMDVCVVTAGRHVPELLAFCEAAGWTYVTTSANKTGLALNKAIDAHSNARRCFKLDEDIFVANGFFGDMIEGYEAIRRGGKHTPGFCSPMLNVNGVSYGDFVKAIGADEAFRAAFGELRQACSGVPAHYDPEVAKWLWRRSVPLDTVAGALRSEPRPVLIGTRFSIGAIYFERDFWHRMKGFASTWRQGILGVDESSLCGACVENSRPMFYLRNVFAGHFSFYPQEVGMMEILPELATIDPATFAADVGR